MELTKIPDKKPKKDCDDVQAERAQSDSRRRHSQTNLTSENIPKHCNFNVWTARRNYSSL